MADAAGLNPAARKGIGGSNPSSGTSPSLASTEAQSSATRRRGLLLGGLLAPLRAPTMASVSVPIATEARGAGPAEDDRHALVHGADHVHLGVGDLGHRLGAEQVLDVARLQQLLGEDVVDDEVVVARSVAVSAR